ncbi:pilus assembly protein TadE [Actinomyces sp. 432]|uniref:TadE/TadG family type IV pilus assembly protein n=1 Tax=Actinomyces sp. 432 TaxID=2057798 RepID=UPI00137419C1|nr:pilus assembly protein TadG-related protein [Actinomyces sp. 432]QHO90782.1 pilus assembly protein TadE [Actinomyces sp. 432]
MRTRPHERGSTSVFAVIVAAVLMALAGLCIDGGKVLNARATLTDTAEQAARAGAQEISSGSMRGATRFSLDAAAARTAAGRHLAASGISVDSFTVSTTGQDVVVSVEEEVPTTMLRIVGVDSVHVSATGTAHAAIGINQEES